MSYKDRKIATKAYEYGFEAEDRACEYLFALGYEIIKRNFHSKFGEIDIIAKKADILHFIEVKATKTARSAIYRITPTKLAKILKAVDFYFLSRGINENYQLDALCFDGQKVEFVENISF